MIRIAPADLEEEAAAALAAYQGEVDAAGAYAERVARAKELFSARNRRENRAFAAVRGTLDRLCRGPSRCMYCEDSAADEVEHFRPKDLYPELVFVWSNYLYACGPCNGPKNNRFAVFSARTRTLVEVSRPKGAPVVEPEPGEPVLIDPRNEDPLELLRMDLRDTFWFLPVHPVGTQEHARADYTIRVLHLNDRDVLLRARSGAFEAYKALIHRYVLHRQAGWPPERLRNLVNALHNMNHCTVWAEMKRQRHQHGELRALFQAAPEALEW